MTPGGLPEQQPARAPAPPTSQPVPGPEPDLDDQLDADEPDDSDESLEDESQPTDTDASDGSPEARVAKLEAELEAAKARVQALQEWEEYAPESQRVQQEQQAKAYWETAEKQAENWYRARSAQIFQEAENAMAPVAYLREQMGVLDNQWRQWLNHFHSQREQAYWDFAMQQSMPNMAAEVVEQHGLGRDAIPELMQYPMELWDREAAKMKQARDREAKLKRAATQAKRKAEKDLRMQNGTFTGEGGAGGNKELALDSDEYYMSIPWQTVRPR
jgi:hypothetical protein